MLAVTFSLMIGSSPVVAAPQDAGIVGVVEFGKIMQQLPETKQAYDTLQSTVAPKQKELERLNMEFQQAVAAYRQKSAKLTVAAREKQEKEIMRKEQELKKYQQEQDTAIGKKQRELFTPIREKVMDAVKAVAQKEGFTIVLDKNENLLVYVSPDHDLTAKVLNLLNIK